MGNSNERLCDTWKQRWRNCQGEEKLTVLGKAMFRAKRRELRKIVSELNVSSVLEAGCGLGETMAVYREMGLKVTGVDISEDAVALCRKKGLDARAMPIEDIQETYDLVSSDGMLEHFLHFEPMARELMRLAQRYVLIIQPNYSSRTGQTMAWLANLLRGSVNVYEYNYRLDDFHGVFAANGFTIFRSVPVFGDVFRILLYQRIANHLEKIE